MMAKFSNWAVLLNIVVAGSAMQGCGGKQRSFATGTGAESGSIVDDGDVEMTAGAGGVGPAGVQVEPAGSEQLEPVGLAPVGAEGERGVNASAAPSTSCIEGSIEACGPAAEEGTCKFGTRTCLGSVWGECIGAFFGSARDCSSVADNDCDGQPDNTVDDVCRCPVMGTRPCDEHPGLDGRGPCQAGVQTCVLGEANATSDWSVCSGSVGPESVDSCEVAGNDSNCDGTPNAGCSCVEGTVVPCGPDTDDGICQRGMSICTGGAFSACQGASFPESRDCSSAEDNDCDGLPDDSLDGNCTCDVGAVRACGEHPGRDGNGPCRAGQQVCQAGAQNATSSFGACSGSVGPALRDSCTVLGDDADCSGAPNTGCQCVAGQGNAPCSGDTNNSRCNAQGACSPCQGNADCSLVGGGRNLCNAGVCSAARCGDGAISAGEQCDDGNASDTDGCTNACRAAACGDGFIQAANDEDCDDRNTVNADGCSALCRITRTPHGAVSFGAYHMCTPLASGRVMCWGFNTSGQLGTGDRVNSSEPVPVANINSAVEVALSDIATCARLSDGTARCWGANGRGNLGSAAAADSNIPVPVPNLTGVVQLSGGGSGFCAVVGSGRVLCWGDSSPTEGGVTDKNVTGMVQTAAGNLHFCGVRTNGTMACWGSNLAGQFGNGRQTDNQPAAVETPLTDVAEVAAGGDTTCVRFRSGAVSCFGSGGSGQLGNNASLSSLTPVPVSNLTNAVKLAGAADHFCALTTTQTVRCWGNNLGGGSNDAPTTITLPSNAVDVGGGADASCALLDDDTVRCWGSGFAGQLGTGVLLNNGSAAALQVLNIP